MWGRMGCGHLHLGRPGGLGGSPALEPSTTSPGLGLSMVQAFPNQQDRRKQKVLFISETLPLSYEFHSLSLPGGRCLKISRLRLVWWPSSLSGLRGNTLQSVFTISRRMEVSFLEKILPWLFTQYTLSEFLPHARNPFLNIF